MKLLSRFARVRIAGYEWQTGDDILLPDVTVTLGENERASSCQFSIVDRGLLIGAAFQKMSIATGGIQVPPNLLKSPHQSSGSGTLNLAPDTSSGAAGAAQVNGSPQGDELARAIIAECRRQGITDNAQIAYVLATAEHESKMGVYLKELGDNARFTRLYEGRSDLGNTQPGDGARYAGRGYVQITGRANYAKWSQKLGIDLVNNPDLASQPSNALTILVRGMKEGSFTGVGLSTYISGSSRDYYNARKIINGTDEASLIAGYAQSWEAKIPSLSGGSDDRRNMTPQAPAAQPNPSQQAVTEEASSKGTEIIIELGYDQASLIDFHFIHTATQTSKDDKEITTFQGKSIRWLLTRVPQTLSYQDVTLKQVIEQQARAFNLKVEMEGSGPTYTFLDGTAITPFKLMARELQPIGFRIADDGKNKLIIEPEARPNYSDFVVDEDILISAKFTDEARADQPAAGATASAPVNAAGETKTAIDRQSGSLTTLKPDSLLGTVKAGAEGNAGVTTGAQAPPVSGTPKPQTAAGTGLVHEPKLDPKSPKRTTSKSTDSNGDTITNQTEEERIDQGRLIRVKTTEVNKLPTSGTATKATTVVTSTYTESQATIVTQKTVGGVTTTTTTTSSDVPKDVIAQLQKVKGTAPAPTGTGTAQPNVDAFGLPKQQPGAIDLLDGRAEGQALSDEAKRVRGYVSELTLMTTEEVLQVVPSQIIGLSGRIFPEPFNREWRVGDVSHNWANNTTLLTIYTPQRPVPGSSGGLNLAPDTSTPAPTGDCNQRIAQAAQAMRGFDTSSGPGRGRVACQWAVNRVLEKASVRNPWGSQTDYAPTAEQVLRSGAGTPIPLGQAQPGDVIFMCGSDGTPEHVGVCIGSGRALSNSSSRAKFVWETTFADYSSNYGGPCKAYRLKC